MNRIQSIMIYLLVFAAHLLVLASRPPKTNGKEIPYPDGFVTRTSPDHLKKLEKRLFE